MLTGWIPCKATTKATSDLCTICGWNHYMSLVYANYLHRSKASRCQIPWNNGLRVPAKQSWQFCVSREYTTYRQLGLPTFASHNTAERVFKITGMVKSQLLRSKMSGRTGIVMGICHNHHDNTFPGSRSTTICYTWRLLHTSAQGGVVCVCEKSRIQTSTPCTLYGLIINLHSGSKAHHDQSLASLWCSHLQSLNAVIIHFGTVGMLCRAVKATSSAAIT